ncbi:MAG: hypothetical protein H7A42_03910 [Chlamydiales bacterium]|nr:hypothetical protein [Chlamydiales bacterium]
MAFQVRAVSTDAKIIGDEPYFSQAKSSQDIQESGDKKVQKLFVMNQRYGLGTEHLITGETNEIGERLFIKERGLTPLYTWDEAEKGDLFEGPGPVIASRFTFDADRIFSETEEVETVCLLDERAIQQEAVPLYRVLPDMKKVIESHEKAGKDEIL